MLPVLNFSSFQIKIVCSNRSRFIIMKFASIFKIIVKIFRLPGVIIRGGVEDTRLEAKTKDTKKIRGQDQGQGQPFRGQTFSRPRTGMLEAKNTSASALLKKKVFTKIFQAISTKKRFPKNFSRAPQNFNNSKSSAVLEPRTGQFSRSRGQGQSQGLDLRGQGQDQGLQNVSSRTLPLFTNLGQI